ncbi:MAG: leucyl/phenylalanyl-tRNA--protein transferase [Treponema sp.]|jgi:leucyl/phenylalanyl-tRNA--protein transferase|nr:leucyl/phenylalanyl-tRNA--protein transferase [Treponema sp.]
MRAGPDPDFPYLGENQYFSFPSPQQWEGDIVAIGGNLSPGMLLSAYEQGIFPWYNDGDPVIWQSPDPRFLIFQEDLHISSSMRKILRKQVFSVTFDKDFYGVIKGCAEAFRPRQNDVPAETGERSFSGTWISSDIIEAYTELFRLGFAHSAEAWQDGELAGGCYGISMGRVFIGESMFARKSNASKAAFLSLAEKLFEKGFAFIDCQTPSRHLKSLGGEEMSRENYLLLLRSHEFSRLSKNENIIRSIKHE